MESQKIINPKTGKKIDLYGPKYNELLNEGYIYMNGVLVKPEKQKYVEESEEETSETSSEEDQDYPYDEEEEEYAEDVEEFVKSQKQTYQPFEEKEEYFEEKVIEPQGSIYPTFYERKPGVYQERMVHVRCLTCNKPIGVLEKSYLRLKSMGMTPEEAYEKLGIKRYCCKHHLERPPLINFNTANEEKIKDYPSAEPVRVNKTLSRNPYLSQTNVNVNTNVRTFEKSEPVQTKINYSQLKSRPLAGGKYKVSYIGK